MDGALYAVHMPKFLRKCKLLFKTFLWINTDIMNVDSEHHIQWFSSRLWCKQAFDYDISPFLQEIFP